MKSTFAVRRAAAIAFAIALFVTFDLTACKPSGAPERHLTASGSGRGYETELHDFETVKPLADLRKSIEAEYLSLTGRLNLPQRCTEKTTTADADANWHILDWAAFYSLEATYANRAQECLEILQNRGISNSTYIESTHKVLVITHQTEGAERLRTNNPDLHLEQFPEIRDKRTTHDGLSVMKPEVTESSTVDLVSLPLRGDRFFVLASSHCSFSKRAAQDIAGDDDLKARMKDLRWIALPHDITSLGDTRKWNESFPNTPLLVIYDFSPIAELKLLTPTFVHMKDGVIVDTFSGWPGPAQKEKLRKFLTK